MPSEDCYIRIATEDDREKILHFLRKFYFNDAPLSEYLKLTEAGNCMELEEASMRNLDDGLTIIATTKLNEVIGAVMCERLRCSDYGMSKNQSYNKMLRLFDMAEKPIWEGSKIEIGIRKEIYLKDASVDSAWRRKGIFRKLSDRLYEIARQKGYSKIWVTCSSYYSAHGLEKAGYSCVSSVRYEDFKEDGEVVFRPPAPHTHLKVMVKSV